MKPRFHISSLIALVIQTAIILGIYRYSFMHPTPWPRSEFVRLAAIFLGCWLICWDVAWLFIKNESRRALTASWLSLGFVLLLSIAICAFYLMSIWFAGAPDWRWIA